MKTLVFLPVVICFFVSCLLYPNLYAQTMTEITVYGKAENSKAGAIVITTANEVYYLEGITSWSESFFGKNVEVTGLLQKDFQQSEGLRNEKGEYKQGLSGEVKTITKPVCRLVTYTITNDKVLTSVQGLLPQKWTMTVDGNVLHIKCSEKAYLLFENKINAPVRKETEKDKEERFKKHGKLTECGFSFLLKQKQNKRSDKMPDYISENYWLFILTETGMESEFVSVYPEQVSEQMYQIKNLLATKLKTE